MAQFVPTMGKGNTSICAHYGKRSQIEARQNAKFFEPPYRRKINPRSPRGGGITKLYEVGWFVQRIVLQAAKDSPWPGS